MRNGALDSSGEKERQRMRVREEGIARRTRRNSVTGVHALLARAKLPDMHRRMRNDGKHGNVSREKCTAPRERRTVRVFSYGEVTYTT